MPAPSSSLRFIFRSIADFVFPPICYGCDEDCESGLVCESCRLLLFTSELDVCPKCGRPCLRAEDGCSYCRIPFCLERVRAVGSYSEPIKGIVHALKYSGKTSLAPLLGSSLALLAQQDSELSTAEVVCAVPLHPARVRERGYNQSELLARELSAEVGLPLAHPLVRRRNTGSQTRQRSDEARVRNLKDAFAVKNGAEVAGRRVLLVDDVMTTGATLHAAGEQLLAAGASAVLGLVVAA